MNSERKRISCRRCQLRKLKCTRIHPCSSCIASGSECNYRENDARRRPVNRSYVAALEERIGAYEATIRSYQHVTPDQAVMSSGNATETASRFEINEVSNPDLVFDYTGSSRISTLTLHSSLKEQGHNSFYGPTSIYQKSCVTEGFGDHEKNTYGDNFIQSSDPQQLSLLCANKSMFQKALSNFFQYLKAEFLSIDQQTLMQDFFNQKYANKFWSYPLVCSVSRLGAQACHQLQNLVTLKDLDDFVNESLTTECLEVSKIVTVQTLLCQAFVELGAGNNTKGWMLSGMAFRMGQDLGLNTDPRFLAVDDPSIQLSHDLELRRQVYWGCYISDKVISLFFGRPVCLRDEDASVAMPGFLDEISVSSASQPTSPEFNGLSSVPLGDNATMAVLFHLAELGKIIESMISNVFSTKIIKLPRKELVTHRVAKLQKLNVQLFKWYSTIPESLAWHQWTPTTQRLLPEVAVIHALYHSALISLNRHFIRPTPGFARKSQAREICITSVESILGIARQYRAQHTLAKAPLTLVYSLVMAATAVTFALGNPGSSVTDPTSEVCQHLKFINKALKECSEAFDVALHFSEQLQEAISGKRKCSQPTSTNVGDQIHVDSNSFAESVQIQTAVEVGIESLSPSWWHSELLSTPNEGVINPMFEDQEVDLALLLNWDNQSLG